MSEQLSPRAQEIVEAARRLLDEEGPAALSMRNVADRVGVRAPSLYKHFADKEAIEHAVVSTVFTQLAEAFDAALTADDPAAALAEAYRGYAKQHPHLYRLMTERPLDRELLAPGAEDRAASPARLLARDDEDAGRALWAFAHGMTILELNGRFPPGADIEAAWRAGLEAFRRYTAPDS